MEKKLVLIDGNSIINRAFYGVPDLTNKDGLHTNAIYGFLNIMFKLMDEEEPTHMMVAFDEKAPTFRHEMYGKYKGTRKPMPEELREQVPVLKDILQAMNLCIFSREGIEADDILGTMAKKGEKDGYTVTVVSGDRDLLQLASDTVMVRIPKTRGGRTEVEDYHTAQVIEKYHVTPSQIIDLKGLMGDTSDNIPGVPGIGEKTAVKILTLFGTVENAIAHREEITPNRAKEAIKNNIELAKLSKQLATIKTDCKLGISTEDCLVQDMFNAKAFRIIQSLDIKSLQKRFDRDKTMDSKWEKRFVTLKTREEWDKFRSSAKEKKRKTKGIGGFGTVVISLAILFCLMIYGSNRGSRHNSADKTLTVHYIDVGQGDCICITCGGETMLIDCGEASEAETVRHYLNPVSYTHLTLPTN